MMSSVFDLDMTFAFDRALNIKNNYQHSVFFSSSVSPSSLLLLWFDDLCVELL